MEFKIGSEILRILKETPLYIDWCWNSRIVDERESMMQIGDLNFRNVTISGESMLFANTGDIKITMKSAGTSQIPKSKQKPVTSIFIGIKYGSFEKDITTTDFVLDNLGDSYLKMILLKLISSVSEMKYMQLLHIK